MIITDSVSVPVITIQATWSEWFRDYDYVGDTTHNSTGEIFYNQHRCLSDILNLQNVRSALAVFTVGTIAQRIGGDKVYTPYRAFEIEYVTEEEHTEQREAAAKWGFDVGGTRYNYHDRKEYYDLGDLPEWDMTVSYEFRQYADIDTCILSTPVQNIMRIIESLRTDLSLWNEHDLVVIRSEIKEN